MNERQEFSWIWFTLWNDMRVCENHLTATADRTGNPWRRHYVRAFFAFVEAVTHNMREIVLVRYREGAASLSDNELFILRSWQPDLKESGEIGGRPMFFKTIPLIKFSMKCFAKYVKRDQELTKAFGKPAWADFTEVQKVRNNITHPKMVDELVLKDCFMKKVKNGGEWFVNVVIDLIDVDFRECQNHEVGKCCGDQLR